MNKSIKDIGVGVLVGLIIAVIGANTIGIMAAVAVPESLIQGNFVQQKLMVWDIFVVQVIGIGVIAGLLTFVIVRLVSNSWLKTSTTIFLVVLGLLTFPNYASYPSSFIASPWWAHAHEVVVMLSVMLFGYLGRRKNV